MDFKQKVIDDKFEWLKHNENKMVGNTLSFRDGYEIRDITKINGVWTLKDL